MHTVIRPLPPFCGFTDFTPTVPALYWDVYSSEQRIKSLCMEYAKLVAYVSAMADTLNTTVGVVNKMESELPELVANTVKTDAEIQQLIKDSVTEYIQTLTKGTTYADIATYGFLHDTESV